MILTTTGGLVEVVHALLKRPDGTKLRYFSRSEGVIKYLQQHPDQDFLLEASKMGTILVDTTKDQYGPEFGDVFCGQVKFDSKTKQVMCT